MGNKLIIKDADFASVAIENVSDNWVSLVGKLFQSFISGYTTTPYKIYNAHYNSDNTLIPRYVMLSNSLDAFYNSANKDIRIFVPDTVRVRPWVMKNLPTPNANDGTIFTSGSTDIILADVSEYVTGTNNWVSLRNFCYEQTNASESVYPYYGATFARSSPNTSSAMSVQNLIDLGFRIEEYMNS